MIPTVPTLILSAVIATLYAALFHLLWGRVLRQLLVYWLVALLGFVCGQTLAATLGWRDWIRVGEIRLIIASVACWLAMVFARQLKL